MRNRTHTLTQKDKEIFSPSSPSSLPSSPASPFEYYYTDFLNFAKIYKLTNLTNLTNHIRAVKCRLDKPFLLLAKPPKPEPPYVVLNYEEWATKLVWDNFRYWVVRRVWHYLSDFGIKEHPHIAKKKGPIKVLGGKGKAKRSEAEESPTRETLPHSEMPAVGGHKSPQVPPDREAHPQEEEGD